MDDLTSRYNNKSTVCARRRCRMRRAGARIRTKIRNLIDDIHRKMIKWLCQHYEVILLPQFDTQRMVSKRDGRRRIRSKTARAMANWAHFRFRSRLLDYSREYPQCHIEIVDEAYTSRTCGSCGVLNQKLGGSKILRCAQCNNRVDRDLNGARNIYLRYLTTAFTAKERADSHLAGLLWGLPPTERQLSAAREACCAQTGFLPNLEN